MNLEDRVLRWLPFVLALGTGIWLARQGAAPIVDNPLTTGGRIDAVEPNPAA
jgi:hypothetical protein